MRSFCIGGFLLEINLGDLRSEGFKWELIFKVFFVTWVSVINSFLENFLSKTSFWKFFNGVFYR